MHTNADRYEGDDERDGANASTDNTFRTGTVSNGANANTDDTFRTGTISNGANANTDDTFRISLTASAFALNPVNLHLCNESVIQGYGDGYICDPYDYYGSRFSSKAFPTWEEIIKLERNAQYPI